MTKILKILYKLIGIIPYLIMVPLVVYLWTITIPLEIPPSTIDLIATLQFVLKPINILMSLSLLGIFAFWYLFCKILKVFLYWSLPWM